MFKVTNQPIDLQKLVDHVTDPEAGAIATFIGTTRNNNEGRKVIALDYEAYAEMAEKELARIGADAAKNWPIRRMAIPDIPTPYNVTLMNAILPKVDEIAAVIADLVEF
jgi:molybdopterin synthase catalytic subunit